jgi:FMN phosphatase YigB (HAD superfamily)
MKNVLYRRGEFLMYTTIIFDLDDTLINNKENIKEAIREVLKYKGEEFTEEKFKEWYELDVQFWRDRANGIMKDPYEFESKEEKARWVRSQRFIRYFKDISLDEAMNLNEIYIEALKNHVIPIEGAKEMIEYLHNKNYKIVIATNGPKVAVPSKLEKIYVSQYVNEIFGAEEARLYEAT